MIIPRSQWPKYLLQFKELKGIRYVKTCSTGDPLGTAHAHCRKYYRKRGWICLDSKLLIKNKKLMLHEVAHLIAGYEAHHGDKWRRVCINIGGTLSKFRLNSTWISKDMHKKKRKL